MFKKLAGLLAALGLVITVVPVQAGGWAVVTLDDLPASVVANQSLRIGFTIRAHGQTPINVEAPAIVFRKDGDGDDTSLRFEAQQHGPIGHYVAQIKLPEGGQWHWHITTWMNHPMPDLAVWSGAPVSGQPATLADTLAQIPFIGGLFGQANQQAKQRAELTRQTALGRDLFLAKGCAMCHTHDAVSDHAGFNANVGPNLTHRPLDPNYLRVWLKDPSAVKPKTEMPNLNLNKAEIEALTTFLTQSAPVTKK